MESKLPASVVLEQPTDEVLRRSLRILTMVHELHKAGYQKLRISPGMSPSGCYWRCSITPVSNILRSHGALLKEFENNTALYGSGQENEYFGWKDAASLTARELASRFIERYPNISRHGVGEDWNYAGWYVLMLGFAERGQFPIAYQDWHIEPNPRFLTTTKGVDSGLPMPPPGEAD